ncbi:MAG: transcriptional regulator, family [Conexibacter sp.]|jgi:transcriptional regulator with XRE-family HTH domain|nr:transcriptional regulator, family [Conexibacter sp.]
MAQQKSQEPALGIPPVVAARLRAHRERHGMSARSLAREVRCSPSLISQIENGKANPSVATLYAIVSALGISLDELFADPEPADRPDQLTAAERLEGGMVLRSDRRPSISLASGVHWERLTPTTDPDVDFLYVTYDVGGASCPPDALMRHNGREYGLVLAGRLGATVGFDNYELEPGDSIVLPSTTPHRFWTIGDQPTTVVWTVVGRTGDPRSPFDS